jgi:hypothetical protein
VHATAEPDRRSSRSAAHTQSFGPKHDIQTHHIAKQRPCVRFAAGANPWPFVRWPGAQQQQWQQLLRGAREAAAEGQQAWKARGGRIMGNDVHEVRVATIVEHILVVLN